EGLVRGLVALGRLHLNAKQLVAADRVTRQAVAEAEGLARRAPRDPAIARLLVGVRTQRADLYALRGQLKEAEDTPQKALEVIRETTPLLPNKALALADEGETVARLGVFYREVGQFQRAEELLLKALRLYEESVRANPSELRYQRSLAASQGLLGDVY